MDIEKVNLDQVKEVAFNYLANYGTAILSAIAIFVVGKIVAKTLKSIVAKLLKRTDVEVTVVNFISNIVYWILLTVVIMAALSQIGVETTSFVAILGAAGFAIGFALKDSLSHFAAGVMLLVFKPFKAGDVINSNGITGKVDSIELFTTTLIKPDNIKVIIPNSAICSNVIENISTLGTRRLDVPIGIAYEEDIEKAISSLHKIVKEQGKVLDDPQAEIVVNELADSSVNLIVRVWVKSADYLGVLYDLNKKCKYALDEANIEIPYPKRVLEVKKGIV